MRLRSDQKINGSRINKKEWGTINTIENHDDFRQKRGTISYGREEHKKTQCFF